DALLRNPITGIAGCCARATSGHVAAAPPRSVMKSRRFIIRSPRRPARAAVRDFGAERLGGCKIDEQQRASLENLVSTAGQWQRNCNAERAGGLHVDIQLDLGYLLDRQVGRFFALEYAAGVDASLTVRLCKAACVTHQAASNSEVARLVDRGHRVTDS